MLVSILSFTSTLLVATQLVSRYVEAHGTIVDPVSRNSLWRVDHTAPVNYNDIEMFCGGIGVSIPVRWLKVCIDMIVLFL